MPFIRTLCKKSKPWRQSLMLCIRETQPMLGTPVDIFGYKGRVVDADGLYIVVEWKHWWYRFAGRLRKLVA